jgi:hypothetical protein
MLSKGISWSRQAIVVNLHMSFVDTMIVSFITIFFGLGLQNNFHF